MIIIVVFSDNVFANSNGITITVNPSQAPPTILITQNVFGLNQNSVLLPNFDQVKYMALYIAIY